jgi:hypothetical protein
MLTFVMLSVAFSYCCAERRYAERRYAGCSYAECHYAECLGAHYDCNNVFIKQDRGYEFL